MGPGIPSRNSWASTRPISGPSPRWREPITGGDAPRSPRSFSGSGVEGYGASIEEVARGLLEPIFERERKAVAAGENDRGETDFINESTLAEGNIRRDPDIIAGALRTKKDFGEFILSLIAERRQSRGGEDLLSRLCRAEVDGYPLRDEETRLIIAGMLLEGGETTDDQLGGAAVRADQTSRRAGGSGRGSRPDGQRPDGGHALLRDRPVPRLHGDRGHGGGRGQNREGCAAGALLAAANHDPRRFENPDEFDIYGEDHDAGKAFNGSAEHLGFGTGARFCIGSHHAKAEQEIALYLLLDNVCDIRLAEGFEAPPNPRRCSCGPCSA